MTNAIYERFFQVVNPRDRIKLEDIKDNQLLWLVSQRNQSITLSRFVQHPWNPYQVIGITEHIPKLYNTATPYSYGKDKVFGASLYSATEESIIMLKLDYQFNIPAPIDVDKWKEEKLRAARS